VRSGRPLVTPRAALAVFVGSSTVAALSFRRAIAIDPLPPTPAPQASAASIAVPAPSAGTAPARLAAALNKDPFHPERRKPLQRFRLPGEALPATAAASETTASPFQLIGTAVMPEGRGFAMCQWGADPPKLVRIGERVGTLTLKTLTQGRAVFVDAGGRTMEVRVPKAGT
jgi:hypothetical protein